MPGSTTTRCLVINSYLHFLVLMDGTAPTVHHNVVVAPVLRTPIHRALELPLDFIREVFVAIEPVEGNLLAYEVTPGVLALLDDDSCCHSAHLFHSVTSA